MRCLFLGSGDLRHTLDLIRISPSVHEWESYLVDINPYIVARNLLFLQLLNNDTVSIDDFWPIWYDFLLEK
ncbi:unnamed protein product [Rotaria sordida]|uniref:DUF4470 domain-containing protein n=1 Tax=Rotaria sordida TaxID=392033 RepID=A0A819FXZ7_9BILA|nr:unnamed protein product [Rotaria sordida]